ncbi:hypothetical protein SCHPADRAFT_935403 [Schizopora paradoxa]|uniref:non-specific serine/threonine protein kinase n=1 Tax=Schizopora paradoxa TaxID=27342 RepID=A0A0H2S5T5_9AGAM|nr:hypothetical protein SCHPADRAFT_935403 [Schizopora paradoxa]
MADNICIPFVILGITDGPLKFLYNGNLRTDPSKKLSDLNEDIWGYIDMLKLAFDGTPSIKYYKLEDPLSGDTEEIKQSCSLSFSGPEKLSKAYSLARSDIIERCNLADTSEKIKDMQYRLLIVVTWSKTLTSSYAGEILPTIHENGPSAREEALERAYKRDSPSTEATLERVRLRQKSNISDAFYNNRPLSLGPTPIAVYEPAFARFAEKVNKTNIVSGDFTREELQFALDFIRTCSRHYANETKRHEDLETLDFPGFVNLWLEQTIHGPNNSTYRPDGGKKYTSRFRQAVFTVLAELKNEKGEGNCDASDQVQCSYTKAYEGLRQQSCCPAFLIALTGVDLVIWGAVTADRFFFEPLASIMLVPMPKNSGRTALESKMLEVVNVFRALREGVDELVEHYAKLPNPPSVLTSDSANGSRPIATRSGGGTSCSGGGGKGRTSGGTSRSGGGGKVRSGGGPTFHTNEYIPGMFPRWHVFVSESEEYKLEYVRRLPTNFEKPIFLAKMTGGSEVGKDVVVKFAPSYCPEAHKLLGDLKLAPKLHYAKFEPCSKGNPDAPDMWVVVMDFIEKATHPSMQLEERHSTKLRRCVDELHAKGYVYGDLRRPNILVRDDELFLIDFDWANEKSKARYPLHIYLEETPSTHNWHRGVTRGGEIEIEHDVYRLESIIAGKV